MQLRLGSFMVCVVVVMALSSGVLSRARASSTPPSEIVKEAQELLAQCGYDPGPPDGRAGPGTRAAVREFQQDQKLATTGEITAELVALLRSQVLDNGTGEMDQGQQEWIPLGDLLCEAFGISAEISNGGASVALSSVDELICGRESIELAEPSVDGDRILTKEYGDIRLGVEALYSRAATFYARPHNGAEVNAKLSNGVTALFLGSGGGHVEVVNLLLSNGADVNAKEAGGWTALILASQNGRAEVVNLLLSNGADVNAEDNNGMTAVRVAARNGHQEIVEILEKAARPGH